MPSVFPERVKGLKITRKLTISIVCLVLSLAFCVWAVLAWFVANSEADAAGMNISVSSDDLGIGLLVYPLEQTGENSYVIKKGEDGNPVQGSTSLNMPAYTSGECTAVLIAITVSNSAADMQYSDVPISLSCSGGAQLGAYSAAENKFSCAISNAVTVWSADAIAGGETEERGDDVYSKKSNSETEPGNEQSFVDAAAQPVEKQSVLQLSPLIEIDAYPDKVTANYIMDYSPELMSWLYGLALGALGAGADSPALTASIDFADDLTFNIGSGTGTEVCEHVWTYAQLDQTAANYSTHHNAVCSKCGETQEEEHVWGEWTENAETGMRERFCLKCQYNHTEAIPAKDIIIGSEEISNLPATITSETAINEYVSIMATSERTVTVSESSATYQSGDVTKEFTYRLGLGGSGNTGYRSVKINTSSANVTIIVYCLSGNSSNDRTLNFISEAGDAINSGTAAGSPDTGLSMLTFTASEAGTYYLVSAGSGINIYGIEILYS